MKKRWIIEEDCQVTETRYYAVEADTLDEAIDLSADMEPDHMKTYSNEYSSYGDSHEATPEEWAGYRPEDSYIPLESCIFGHVYRVVARNFGAAVFDGVNGFVGLRHKFGEVFLDTELHWDAGESNGTVKPMEDLGSLPDDVPFEAGDNFELMGYLQEIDNFIE